jgi:hypothetical protein
VDEAEAAVVSLLLLLIFHDLRAAGLPQSFFMVKRARSSGSLAFAEWLMELSNRGVIRRRTRRLGMATVIVNGLDKRVAVCVDGIET